MKCLIYLSLFSLLIIGCETSHQNNSVLIESAPTIINGREASQQDVFSKHVVAIIVKNEAHCTGVVIAADAVLTAAHCAPEVREGALAFGLNKKKYIVRHIRTYKKYEKYNPDISGISMEPAYDILVLKFSGGLPPGYAPVKMPSETTLVQKEQPVILAGFGRDENDEYDYLKSAEVVVRDVFESEFLTNEKHAGTCDGDSGGPVFQKLENGEHVLVGIASRGDESCRSYGVYEKVFFYKQWIEDILKML